MMHRHALTSAEWMKICSLLPAEVVGPSRQRTRRFIDAVVWAAKTGVVWRDLPARFGGWKTVYSRFRRWAIKGHWDIVFKHLSFTVEEVEALRLDSTRGRGRQIAAGGGGERTGTFLVEALAASQRKATRR